jgi:ABC-type Zn2+ transport system substrate-binding protein/surface adhesin
LPETKTITKTELVARVKMSWMGPVNANSPARRLQVGQQIFIAYRYIDIVEPVYIDLTNNNDDEEEEEEEDEEEEEEEESAQQEEDEEAEDED